MPTTPPYIPPRDTDFDVWFLNFSTLLTASPTTYGLVAGDATIVSGLYTTWHAAYLAATNPGTRTPVTVAAKDIARVNATVVLRPYAQRIAVNPSVSNANKVAIGVTVRSTVPTPIPAPTTYPILALLSLTPGLLQYAFKDSALGPTKQKPFGAIGMELWAAYAAGTVEPVTAADYQGTATKSPNTLDTTGQTGKTISLYARWVTKSGPAGNAQVGPWSTVLSAVVP